MLHYIKVPTGERMHDVVNGFKNRWGMPQVGGAVDGIHIPIIAPVDHHADYYNRKGCYSVVMQAVVDFRHRFMDVKVGWPGSVTMPEYLKLQDFSVVEWRGHLFLLIQRTLMEYKFPWYC